MNWLPIASRELRVAARKRSTYWVRAAAASTGLAIGVGCFLLNLARGVSTAQMGSVLFHVLAWLGLAVGLAAGLFFTSDCLSEEKREGTLGLLFLTNLRGHDVALGKLLATSVRGLLALLAVFPILALTQLMGGVSSGQYWRSALALANALHFSLAAGLLVSALSRDSQKAMAGTLLLLASLALGGPLADAIIAAAQQSGFRPFWSLTSPAYALVSASGWGNSKFWTVLGVTQALGWGMLGLACALVPHTWQDRRRGSVAGTRSWTYAWRYGGTRRRERARRKLLDGQPMTWLAGREIWQSRLAWILAVLVVGLFGSVLLSKVPREAWVAWYYLGGLFTSVLYLWAASQSSRFFVEGRRSGMIALAMSTAVSRKEVVDGQWRALVAQFAWPLLLMICVHVAASTLGQISLHRLTSQAMAAANTATTNSLGMSTNQVVLLGGSSTYSTYVTSTNVLGPGVSRAPMTTRAMVLAVATGAAAAISTAGNLLALLWFGMWMGLTSRSASLATLKTLLFVQVIPWFAITFVSGLGAGLLMLGGASGRFLAGTSTASWSVMEWMPLLSAVLQAVLAIAKDAGFILWSRRKLHGEGLDLPPTSSHGRGIAPLFAGASAP